jgi:hypothetical protein
MSYSPDDEPDDFVESQLDRALERADLEYEIWRDDQVLHGCPNRLEFLRSALASVDPSL